MIKSDMGRVQIKGPEHIIEAELIMLIEEIKETMIRKKGEKEGNEKMQILLKTALMSDQELKEAEERNQRENPDIWEVAGIWAESTLNEMRRKGQGETDGHEEKAPRMADQI